MKLTNDTSLILLSGKTWTERYYRDKQGWVKISARRRKFRATAEQVLNHLLPALAGLKPNVCVQVKQRGAAVRVQRHGALQQPRKCV
jgi:hypothetical protein